MPTTVVSFIGRGSFINNDRSKGYKEATYKFPEHKGEELTEKTTCFGVALLKYLQSIGESVDYWVVLGTNGSIWGELYRALENNPSVKAAYDEMEPKGYHFAVTEDDLAKWQNLLNAGLSSYQMRLCLTGDAMNPQSQQQIARAMFQWVAPKNELVIDITHGFRHQPVLATSLSAMMRRTHQISGVRYYSGVLEATDKATNETPVLELPICQNLLEATESAAIMKATGNYEAVASRFDANLAREAWFLESTNQLWRAREPVQRLAATAQNGSDAIDEQLAGLLRDRLAWTDPTVFARCCEQVAREALERDDYLRAVVLTYEGLRLVALSRFSNPNQRPTYADLNTMDERIKNALSAADSKLFMTLKNVRNSCAHGTEPSHWGAIAAIADRQAFLAMLRKALELFGRIPATL